jgi:hypothetical protein
MSRLLTALASGAVFLLVAAPTVVGKEGVRARLDAPVPLHAAAGRTITIAWTLSYVESGERHPFGASGVFVRLLSASSARPVTAYGDGRGSGPNRGGVGVPGEYLARVRVPAGGIGGITIGLRGWRIIGGRRQRADAFFPIDNDPFAKADAVVRRPPAARRSARAEDGGQPLAIWLAAAVALGALGAILGIRRRFASRRPRRAHPTIPGDRAGGHA